jgi:hypothetical protein
MCEYVQFRTKLGRRLFLNKLAQLGMKWMSGHKANEWFSEESMNVGFDSREGALTKGWDEVDKEFRVSAQAFICHLKAYLKEQVYAFQSG